MPRSSLTSSIPTGSGPGDGQTISITDIGPRLFNHARRRTSTPSLDCLDSRVFSPPADLARDRRIRRGARNGWLAGSWLRATRHCHPDLPVGPGLLPALTGSPAREGVVQSRRDGGRGSRSASISTSQLRYVSPARRTMASSASDHSGIATVKQPGWFSPPRVELVIETLVTPPPTSAHAAVRLLGAGVPARDDPATLTVAVRHVVASGRPRGCGTVVDDAPQLTQDPSATRLRCCQDPAHCEHPFLGARRRRVSSMALRSRSVGQSSSGTPIQPLVSPCCQCAAGGSRSSCRGRGEVTARPRRWPGALRVCIGSIG